MSTATRKGTRTCQYDGREGRCRDPVDYSGWCSKRLRRVERHGDPNIVRPGAWPPGTRRYDAQGYFPHQAPGHPLADSAAGCWSTGRSCSTRSAPDKLELRRVRQAAQLDRAADEPAPPARRPPRRDARQQWFREARAPCASAARRDASAAVISAARRFVGRRSGAKVCGSACRRERSRLRRLSDRKAEFGYSDLTEYLARKRRTESWADTRCRATSVRWPESPADPP